MTKDGFTERFGELPRKDDITILAPKREDPTEQARRSTAGVVFAMMGAAARRQASDCVVWIRCQTCFKLRKSLPAAESRLP